MCKRRNPLAEMVRAELNAAGVTAMEIEFGKHIKIRWTHHGVKKMTVLAMSPSDVRVEQNVRSCVRRQLREAEAA